MIDTIQLFQRHCKDQKRSIKIYESSVIEKGCAVFFLIREKNERKLVIIYPSKETDGAHRNFVAEEEGKLKAEKVLNYKVCLCSNKNASELRKQFSFTQPRVIGLTPAIGTGDRIGLATPGHILAVRQLGVFPVLAQQSIREMARTSRTPQDVMNDVSWAVFQEGYQDGFAADADHLKTESDIEATFEAGFTMYTIDPSDHVDDEADKYDLETLKEKFKRLPWSDLGCGEKEFLKMYLNREIEITSQSEKTCLVFSEEDLLRAAVKYSAAIAHSLRLRRRLDELFKGRIYDLEISVDETSTPTKLLEHLFIALELKRLNIHVQGLALRFVGRFEKAVDYIGDLEEFEKTFRHHVLIARKFGPYKLSIHSGSDKFSIYPILGKLAGDIIHLKTAGTSYLESLRIIARREPYLFRMIVRYSIQHFERDRKTYHIGTELSMIPDAEQVSDEALEKTYLDNDHGRQVLHVTFGSILTAKTEDGSWLFRDRIREVLINNEAEYYKTVSKHLERHIKALWFSEPNENSHKIVIG